ncbi:MAG: phosphoribosylanthranilate isomerase [Candidatus Bathyarchaeia archaeon]
MKTVKVKICGITSKKDLKMVCDMGADAVGFIVGVPSSPRNLTMKAAKRLIRRVPIFVKSVLVVVSQDADEILRLYKDLKPDIIQIHGKKPPEISVLRENLPDALLVRAVTVKSGDALQTAVEEADFFDAVLVDSHSAGKHGGTGVTHDWNISRHIREAIHPKPLILAGGLNPKNVKEAIQTVKPYAVDVSTSVESKPGVKDPEKVAAFIRNAKEPIIKNG